MKGCGILCVRAKGRTGWRGGGKAVGGGREQGHLYHLYAQLLMLHCSYDQPVSGAGRVRYAQKFTPFMIDVQ